MQFRTFYLVFCTVSMQNWFSHFTVTKQFNLVDYCIILCNFGLSIWYSALFLCRTDLVISLLKPVQFRTFYLVFCSLHCCTSMVLQCYGAAVLWCCSAIVLLCYSAAVLLCSSAIVLQCYSAAVL